MNIGRPKLKPNRSFKQFCKDADNTTRLIMYPCYTCKGKKWLYDPSDHPDPIEGNKLRGTLKCSLCKGSGVGKRKDLYSMWRREKAKWIIQQKKYNDIVSILRKIESKLKSTEVAFLKSICERSIEKYFV